MSRRSDLRAVPLFPLFAVALLVAPLRATPQTADEKHEADRDAKQGKPDKVEQLKQDNANAEARKAEAARAEAARAEAAKSEAAGADAGGAPAGAGAQQDPQPPARPGAVVPPPVLRPPAASQAPGAQPATRGTSGTGGGSQDGGVPKMQESGDYFILNLDETGDGIDLMWLTKMCQVATGKNFTVDKTVAQQLSQTTVNMFGEKRIPKAEFYQFYQILMFINGYTITRVGPEHLAVYLVQSLAAAAPARGGGQLKDEAIYVLPNELDRYADEVATQIMTVLHLPHTDVRTLGNSLRTLQSDPNNGVIPVSNTNSVVLRGFAPSVVSLARILRLVDDEAARDLGVAAAFEVIPLEFAAAEDLADILEQLLEAKKREALSQRQGNPQGATGQIQSGGGESKILTYPRTNSLLVMALPEDMAQIKELIARLDVEVIEPERTYHVYALEHVKAKDLSEVLQDFIEGAARVQGSQGRTGRAGGQAAAPSTPGMTSRDNEVVVVPDEATNSLLIAASRRRYEEVVELIHRLDHRQEQVLIETALIELSGSDSLDLGVELGGADLAGSGAGSFGVTNFGMSTFLDNNDDGIPDVRVPTTTQGFTAGILDGGSFNLPILLKAIRSRRDTNVLNIPSVLVNNNGSANVTTLDEQPTTQVTANGVGGQTQENFNDYQKAGITMEISPSISAAGYLRLELSLEVSNFVGSFSGAIPPPRITRTLKTSVSVPNGDTMVIGGIIVDNKDKSRTSLPWLGEIPLLGALFRRDTDTDKRTTLYFFVTPHILRDQNFADLAEISYRVKLDAAEKIGAQRVQLIDERFGAAKDSVNLDQFDVPLYRSPGGGEVPAEMIGKDPAQLRAAEQGSPPPVKPQ